MQKILLIGQAVRASRHSPASWAPDSESMFITSTRYYGSRIGHPPRDKNKLPRSQR